MILQQEAIPPGWHEERAAAVLAAGGEIAHNEYGTPISVHRCATCGERFTVCPPSVTYGPDCLAPECASYDPARDAEMFFAPDDPDLIVQAFGEPT